MERKTPLMETQTIQSWPRADQQGQVGQITLFCIPYSGASASFYRAWSNKHPMINICPIELPGHGMRISEPLYTSIAPLIEDAAKTILNHLPGQFAFFGHSMGALISYELTRYLSANYRAEPVHLFVSGHGAPDYQDAEPPIHELPDEEFIEKIHEMNSTDEAFFACTELREMFLPILRADFTVCETYQYQPGASLRCPITALGGIGDLSVPRSALEAWKTHTSRPFKVLMFSGDHFFLKQHMAIIMEILARELLGGGTPVCYPI
ncbi:MAG: thioesterase [Chloroflexota bacterium]|nr:MAG: thioesterase [Chloroflexota bacterium]